MMKIGTMKLMRIALLAMCTATIGAATMLAQGPPPGGGPGGAGGGMGAGQGGGRGGRGMDPARQLEMMTKALDLTPDQVTKVKAIQADGMAQMMALRDDTSTPRADKRGKMMTMRQAEQAKIKALLTDQQKTRYDAMMEKMRENRGKRQGGDGPPPPPPPAV